MGKVKTGHGLKYDRSLELDNYGNPIIDLKNGIKDFEYMNFYENFDFWVYLKSDYYLKKLKRTIAILIHRDPAKTLFEFRLAPLREEERLIKTEKYPCYYFVKYKFHHCFSADYFVFTFIQEGGIYKLERRRDMEKMCRITSPDGQEYVLPERVIYESLSEDEILKGVLRAKQIEGKEHKDEEEIRQAIRERRL